MSLHTHVVGHPIAHSLSPVIFAAAGVDIHCERADVERGHLADFLAGQGREDRGLSVTMPLKKEALSVCTHIDDLAVRVGAINTIVVGKIDCAEDVGAQRGRQYQWIPNAHRRQLANTPVEDTAVYGCNTDVAGIVAAIRETLGDEATFSNAVILGSGATASSALAAVQELGQPHTLICSRRHVMQGSVFAVAQRLGVPVEYAPLTHAHEYMEHADLVISTLPAHVADTLAQRLRGAHVPNLAVLDVSYDPYPSALSTAVIAAGGIDIPGYEMLIHQGIEQARIFSGREPDTDAIHATVLAHVQRRHAADQDSAQEGR